MSVNKYLCCSLCSGYFRNPYTITECLHTFCHACLLKEFRKKGGDKKCPECGVGVNLSSETSMMADRSLQELIEKIFPKIIRDEEVRMTTERSEARMWGQNERVDGESTRVNTSQHEPTRANKNQYSPILANTRQYSPTLLPSLTIHPNPHTQATEAAFYSQRGIKRKQVYEIKEDNKGKDEKKKGEKGEKKKPIR
ncbi:hypothetical protein TL16_g13205 [Triparma laevis f. inornata]|uniref:RING-type domain-containing protein n=1 Tax=Triparma laevis f. inornata TaxID=1714386 RepID=A0A9W7EWZ3_9STRA|nr:hypothetical protein TL16_g13205 [Triparma laevis f. inornata]